jgi:hypothetical protein
MLANVTCPSCQHRYWLDEGQMGTRQICPKCQAAFFAGKSRPETRAEGAPAASAQPSYAKTMVTEEAPPIKYTCPRYKAPLEATSGEAGTKKNCPNCTQRHQVPAAPKPITTAPAPGLNKTMVASDEGAAPAAPPIKYNCPNCKKPLEAPASEAGTKRNCPFCSQRLQVPAAPTRPNLNKTLLASDESSGPAVAAQGVSPTAHAPAAVPGAPPANPWAQALTPGKVALGVLVLVLLIFVVPAFIRGGKAVDTAAVAEAELKMKQLDHDFELKKMELDRLAKADEAARLRSQEEARARRDEELRISRENQKALRETEDAERKEALRKKQREEQEQREADNRKRDEEFKRLLADSKEKLDKAQRDLEETRKQKTSTQTIIEQPPVIHYAPYHPRYYSPWWW